MGTELPDNDERGDRAYPADLPSPRHSLRVKVIAAVVAMIALSTIVCGYLTARLADSALRQSLRNDAASLTATASRSVATQLADRDLEQLSAFLAEMTLDPRIAFVAVSGVDKQPLARRIVNEDCWSAYLEQTSEAERLDIAQANRTRMIDLAEPGDVLVRTQAIWSERANDEQGRTPVTQFHGYLTLALHDASVARMRDHLFTATIAVVCVVCLLWLPVVVWVMDRWMRPLRRMVRATIALSAGQSPEPLSESGTDEIALLAQSFNAMAGNLTAARGALEQANRNLEEKVARRTEQLQRANRRLEVDMREKDQFIRAVSHDLNAPLRNIVGMTGMVLKKYEKQLDEEVVAKLNRIAANAKSEVELLSDLLDLTRITSKPGRRQTVDLTELIEGIRQSLSYDLEEKGIRFEIAGRLPAVVVNRNRIRQVFQNLIDNAIKYMDPDKDEKQVKVGQEPTADEPTFYVKDNGLGIALEDQARVFQLFQRARYSGTSEMPGRGVGLASVKAIVEFYGGRIWVQSSKGNGTTFYFTLGPACYDPDMEGYDDEVKQSDPQAIPDPTEMAG